MKTTIFTFLLAFIGLSGAFAQVGIGTTTPDASSSLEVQSTERGVLIPRMDETQRDAIASPAVGLMIYNTEKQCLQMYADDPETVAVDPEWDCVSNQGRNPPVFIDEDRIDNGFNGLYFPSEDGRSAYGADRPTFTVTIENTGFSPVSVTVNNSSLAINNTEDTSGDSSLSVNNVTSPGGPDSGVDGYDVPGSGEREFTFSLDGVAPAAGQTITADIDINGVTYTGELVIPANVFSYETIYRSCSQPVANGTGYSGFNRESGLNISVDCFWYFR